MTDTAARGQNRWSRNKYLSMGVNIQQPRKLASATCVLYLNDNSTPISTPETPKFDEVNTVLKSGTARAEPYSLSI